MIPIICVMIPVWISLIIAHRRLDKLEKQVSENEIIIIPKMIELLKLLSNHNNNDGTK